LVGCSVQWQHFQSSSQQVDHPQALSGSHITIQSIKITFIDKKKRKKNKAQQPPPSLEALHKEPSKHICFFGSHLNLSKQIRYIHALAIIF